MSSHRLALVALVALTTLGGCDTRPDRDEDRVPAGLRLQPLPGSSLDQGDSLQLPPVAPRDPLLEPPVRP